ncbi:hypothetical protein KAI92_01925 [Candidatus Parcubacteria bacterium]|nr:hypothetical protein [Candidatus Parcubacteria bacterium]
MSEKKKQNDICINILSLERYKKSYERIDRTDKEKIINIVPDKLNIEKFFPWMEEIIEGKIIEGQIHGGMGLILDSISINDVGVSNASQGEDEDNFQKSIRENIGIINLDISISGVDYDSLKSLLAELENNLRLMDIQSVSFSGNQVSLSINTYYFKDKDLIVKGIEGGNKREVLNLDVLSSNKFKSLEEIDVELDDLGKLEIGNKYPFGLNKKETERLEEPTEINSILYKRVDEIGTVDKVDLID